MINLKLAEYTEEGEFKQFIDFTNFAMSQNVIFPTWREGREENVGWYSDEVYKDERDPLNRFGGLFDDRTYGNGRFVLIRDDQDDRKIRYNAAIAPFYDPPTADQQYELKEHIFNLHEDPELWSKIK